MRAKYFFGGLAAVLCLAVPAAVLADRNSGKALYCDGGDNPVCGLYRVCRPLLGAYPLSEITEGGKDCTLTVGTSQLIIRRKLTSEEDGYFFYVNRLPAGKIGTRP